MTDFAAFLQGLGIRPRKPVVPDGRWYRCPTEDHPKRSNGAYKLLLGGTLGFAQNWATMQEAAMWKAGTKQADALDLRALRNAQQEARGDRIRASDAARTFWSGCEELRVGHPYLERKQLDVTGCYGLRVDGSGWLVVPALRNGIMVSIQRIAPDGTKRFWSGAPIAGSCYEIRRQSSQVTILCEGLATGLACFRAVPNARVMVCWDAGNLAKTAARPTGLVVIAADNDTETEARLGRNPGIEAARQAADAIGCGFAAPGGIQGSDWADLRIERIAQRSEHAYHARTTRSQIERAVDAEIRDGLMRSARFVRPAMT